MGPNIVLLMAVALAAFFLVLGYKKPALALITSPIVCALYVCVSLLSDDYELKFQAMLLAPVILFVTLIAVAVPRQEEGQVTWARKCAQWMLVCSAVLLLGLTVALVIGSLHSFGFLLIIVFLCTVIFMSAMISYELTAHYGTATYVISTLAASMRQNLPLSMALESAAAGQPDRRSRILRNINKWLVRGCSLSDAIRLGYPRCPGHALAMIVAGERINQLPQAMESIEADTAARADESRKLKPVHPFYPLFLIVLVSCEVLGYITYILPNISSILSEMLPVAELPRSTRILVQTAQFIAFDYGQFSLVVLLLLIFVVFPALIMLKFRPRRPQKPYLSSKIGDFIKWRLPVMRWFEKNYSMLQTVEILRLSLNAGATLDDAVANSLNQDVNECFRKRLARWHERILRGQNVADAARDSRLGGSLAWAFDDAVNQGNTITVLETLEALYRSNYSYYANLLRFMTWPCVTILIGAMVGFVVYASFAPNAAIVEVMVGRVTP